MEINFPEGGTMRVIRHHGSNGIRSGLVVTEGRKWIHIMLMDLPIKIRKIPCKESRTLVDLEGYPEGRAKRIFKQAIIKSYGTYRKAPKNIKEALK